MQAPGIAATLHTRLEAEIDTHVSISFIEGVAAAREGPMTKCWCSP